MKLKVIHETLFRVTILTTIVVLITETVFAKSPLEFLNDKGGLWGNNDSKQQAITMSKRSGGVFIPAERLNTNK